MKNMVNSKLMDVINNIAERVGERSVKSCGFFGSFEVEIPLEIINQEE